NFDMVRLGIGLYGVDVTGKLQSRLQNISALKTTIAQIKTIAPGDTIGYGRKGQMQSEGRIATVNIGYADGYFRDFGHGTAYMLVHDKKAPVVGSVCMDMCMIDISDIPEAKEGDEVIVFGDKIP